MARVSREEKEKHSLEILKVVEQFPQGASLREIAQELNGIPKRTLQSRLNRLVSDRRLTKYGERRTFRYSPPSELIKANQITEEGPIDLSSGSKSIRKYLGLPYTARKPVGYDRQFLDSYIPNKTSYLSPEQLANLAEIGTPSQVTEPAGTYARQIFQRLLVDLSWNSSRLEGNTYSLLDTKRLIEFGQEAEGRNHRDAQMILNHKDAIEFLVNEADGIGFNRYTILNLHGILANNLLADPMAAGSLRHVPVGIEKSTFRPLEVPQLIEECFNQVLETANAIENPFEQAFFIMVQLPYLQPFDDVNKRVSRLAANIPFIKRNLVPLSFAEVPRTLYLEATLSVYELKKVDLLRDVFVWAYKRTAEQYIAVRQSLGEPDPFRLKYRSELRQIVSEIVRSAMNRKTASSYIAQWLGEHIAEDDRNRFRDLAESELIHLHEGNFARYQIRPSEFSAWQAVWSAK